MMRIFGVLVLLVLWGFPTLVLSADFVHPLDFKGTQAEKDKVVAYIKETVLASLSKLGMDNPSTLRMMEKNELEGFKKLTKVSEKNRKLLDAVIKQVCGIGMCQYDTIFMMFNQELSASKESLSF